jgi:hypothetical protein
MAATITGTDCTGLGDITAIDQAITAAMEQAIMAIDQAITALEAMDQAPRSTLKAASRRNLNLPFRWFRLAQGLRAV